MNLPPELTQIQVVVTHSCRRICGYCYNKKLFQSTVPEHTKVIESLAILRTKFEQVLGLKPSSCREQDLFF